MTILLALLLGANVFDQDYDSSVLAYNNQDYAQVINLLGRLAQAGAEDPVVYHALGNAFYRQGKLAPAIASYEHALQLDPGFEESRDNLARSILQTERGLPKPAQPLWEQRLLFWHDGIKPQIARALTLAGWAIFWILLAFKQLRPTPYLRRTATLVLLLTLLFAASAWAKTHPPQLAVAGAARVPVHYGTNEQETVHFELYEGDRVIVDKRTNGWARVLTADGERGWVKGDQLVSVARPWLVTSHAEEYQETHAPESLGYLQ